MSTYRTLIKVGEFLFETGKSLFAETDLGKLLPLAMDKIIEQTKAQRGMIVVYSPAGELLFQVARDHHQKDIAQPEAQISTTIVNRVRESGRYVVIENALENPLADKSQSIHRLGILSVAGAPLRHEGEFLGVIYIDNRDVTAVFDDETGKLLSMFAELISMAVKNALKHHRSELERQRLEAEAAKTVLKLQQQSERLRQLKEQLAQSEGYDEIKGLKSIAMLEVCNQIEKVASTDSSVLIIGETGTGKELIARELHRKSARAKQPFDTLNCAAQSNEDLQMSELFGHKKGAFTGAVEDRMGYFETADGGTVFLDEIAKSSRPFQTKLLRVLETGEFNRVGETKTRKTNVRIISAAGPDLPELIKRGEFYPDLYYRLESFVIHLPPLRERREDILEIAEHFLQYFAREHGRNVRAFSNEVRELLLIYSWPGNVRELRNAVNSAVISADGEIIQIKDLPSALQKAGSENNPEVNESTYKQAKRKTIDKFDREFLVDLLTKTNGNVAEAARCAGMDKSNLSKKLHRLRINAKDFEK